MSTAPISPSTDTPPVNPLPAPKSKRRYIPALASWLVGGFVLLVLAGMAIPAFHTGCGRSPRAKAMAQAKQIGLALKIFAGDNDGVYPRAGLPGMPATEVRNANAAFAMLFPKYLTNENLFGNSLSAYQTRPPDNIYDPAYTGNPVRTLEPGENVYAYTMGLTEASDAAAPLVVEGTDGTGHYTTDTKKRGGLTGGKTALVVRLDNSVAIENLAGPDHARYIPRYEGDPKVDKGNLLDVADLGPNVRLLDPAISPR